MSLTSVSTELYHMVEDLLQSPEGKYMYVFKYNTSSKQFVQAVMRMALAC